MPVFAAGCWSSRAARAEVVIVGGGGRVFWAAGEAVPAVPAAANTNGWYSLPAADMAKLLEP